MTTTKLDVLEVSLHISHPKRVEPNSVRGNMWALARRCFRGGFHGARRMALPCSLMLQMGVLIICKGDRLNPAAHYSQRHARKGSRMFRYHHCAKIDDRESAEQIR